MKEKLYVIFSSIVIFAILIIGIIGLCFNTINTIKADDNYWKQRANTADAVIDSILNNVPNPYIDDVLMETDTWEEYYIRRYGEY